MINKFVGGRGKKAPYDTVVIRIPQPIVNQVNLLVDDFRQNFPASLLQKVITKELAIEEAKKILKSKKSAKQSLVKLLQVLYDDAINEKDLNF